MMLPYYLWKRLQELEEIQRSGAAGGYGQGRSQMPPMGGSPPNMTGGQHPRELGMAAGGPVNPSGAYGRSTWDSFTPGSSLPPSSTATLPDQAMNREPYGAGSYGKPSWEGFTPGAGLPPPAQATLPTQAMGGNAGNSIGMIGPPETATRPDLNARFQGMMDNQTGVYRNPFAAGYFGDGGFSGPAGKGGYRAGPFGGAPNYGPFGGGSLPGSVPSWLADRLRPGG